MGNKGEFVQSEQDIFSVVPLSWDADEGDVPSSSIEGEIIFSSFDKVDVVVYTDISLSGRYNKEEPVNLELVYKTESDAQGTFRLITDYSITETGSSPTGAFTNVRTNIVHSTTGLTQIVVEDVIPIRENNSSTSIATIRFGREGTNVADTLVGAVRVLSIRLFQRGF